MFFKRIFWDEQIQPGGWQAVILALSFALGTVLGALRGGSQEEVITLAENALPAWRLFLREGAPIAALALLGTVPAGLLAVPLVFAAKGYTLGRAAAMLCACYGTAKGLLAALAAMGLLNLIVLPLFSTVGFDAFLRAQAESRGIRPALTHMPDGIYLFRAFAAFMLCGLAALLRISVIPYLFDLAIT